MQTTDFALACRIVEACKRSGKENHALTLSIPAEQSITFLSNGWMVETTDKGIIARKRIT